MDGLNLTPLKKIFNPKGDIFHAMKKDDIGFDGFGEAYFSSIHKNKIKGWKKHAHMTLNLIVPMGEIEFVVYNENVNKFFNTKLSQKNYQRLTVKSGLWLAFRGCNDFNLLLNLASIKHNPREAETLCLNKINYQWDTL